MHFSAETDLLGLPLRLPHGGQDTASSQPSELPLVDGLLVPASAAASLLFPDECLRLLQPLTLSSLAQCFYHCHLRWRLETLKISLEVLYLDTTNLVISAAFCVIHVSLRRPTGPV